MIPITQKFWENEENKKQHLEQAMTHFLRKKCLDVEATMKVENAHKNSFVLTQEIIYDLASQEKPQRDLLLEEMKRNLTIKFNKLSHEMEKKKKAVFAVTSSIKKCFRRRDSFAPISTGSKISFVEKAEKLKDKYNKHFEESITLSVEYCKISSEHEATNNLLSLTNAFSSLTEEEVRQNRRED